MNTVAKVLIGSGCIGATLYGIRMPTDHPRYKTNFHQFIHLLNLQLERDPTNSIAIVENQDLTVLINGSICYTCGHVNVAETYSDNPKFVDSYSAGFNMKLYNTWLTHDEYQNACNHKENVNKQT